MGIFANQIRKYETKPGQFEEPKGINVATEKEIIVKGNKFLSNKNSK